MSKHEIDYSGKYNVVSQGGFAEFLSAVGVGAMIQAMAVQMGKKALRSLTIEHEGDLFRTRTVT